MGLTSSNICSIVNKQVTGSKIGWKEKDRKKDKNQRKRQMRWKRMGIYYRKYHFQGILSYGYTSIYLYWFTDALAAFYKICFLFNICPMFLHSPRISVSQSEKMIFQNSWLISVWSWNSDDINFSFKFIAERGVPQITTHCWFCWYCSSLTLTKKKKKKVT